MNTVKKWHQIYRPPIYKLLMWQLFLLLVISFAFLGLDLVAAYSALLGGLIFLIPHWFFTRSAYSPSVTGDVHQIVRSFYKGETSKLLMAAILFAAVFKWIQPLNVFALFVAFTALLFSNGIMLLNQSRTQT